MVDVTCDARDECEREDGAGLVGVLGYADPAEVVGVGIVVGGAGKSDSASMLWISWVPVSPVYPVYCVHCV